MLKPASHIQEAYHLNILPPKGTVQSGTFHNPPSPKNNLRKKKKKIIEYNNYMTEKRTGRKSNINPTVRWEQSKQ